MGVEELIEELNAYSLEQKRDIAVQLAKRGTDEAVDALIQIADGVKSYKPRTWKVLWRKIPREYSSLEEQLIAIQALAETMHLKAYEYLVSLTEYVKEMLWACADPDREIPMEIGSRGTYYNLHGEIGKKIRQWEVSAHAEIRIYHGREPSWGGETMIENSPSYLPEGCERSIILAAQARIKETLKETVPQKPI